MYNRSTLCGRIAHDLELKTTDTGRVYLRFSLAVNNPYNKTVDFVPVTIWNQTAQNVHRFLKKGSLILVDGSIQVRTVGPDNNRRTYFNISANRVVFLESKSKNAAPTSTINPPTSETLMPDSAMPTPEDSAPIDDSSSSSPSSPTIRTNDNPSKTNDNAPKENEEDGIYWSEK